MTENNNKNEVIKSVGRRKRASARVRIKPGSGKITVNGKSLEVRFGTKLLIDKINGPLKAVGKENFFDIEVKVVGGGTTGQAESIRHGIARALIKWNEDFRKTLRAVGYLTRDPREKERKKPGLRRARRAPQWSKR